MIGARAFGSEQQENQIDRLAVERFEIHRPLQPREQAEHIGELGELAVRNGDAVADAGGAELFTLQQNFQNRTLALTRELGRTRGEFLDRLLFAVDHERRNNCRRRDEIGERHRPVQ